MNIVIIGGGSVGFITADYFAREGHNVTVVEEKKHIIARLQDKLDVNVVEGHGTDMSVLESAQVGDADLFLALTDNDEVNIISCTLAKYSNVPRKIARLNKSFLLMQKNAAALHELGVDEVVDTEESLVHEMVKLVKYPGTADLKHFMGREYVVGIFSFSRTSQYYGKPLSEVQFPVPVMPLGYTKVSDFQAYDPNVIVNEFLYVYYGCETKHLEKLHRTLFSDTEPIKNVLLFGRGYKSNTTVLSLSQALKDAGVSSTIVLDDEDEAKWVSARTETPVIFGDPSRPDFARTQEFKKQDGFIALTDHFEKNLFSASVAYREMVPLTISLVRYPEHVNFVSTIPLTAFVNPALVTANKIMKYHKLDSIISRTILNYQQVECVELVLVNHPEIIGKKIKELGFKHSQIVAIRRGHQFLVIDSDTTLMKDDNVLLLLADKEKDKLQTLI